MKLKYFDLTVEPCPLALKLWLYAKESSNERVHFLIVPTSCGPKL